MATYAFELTHVKEIRDTINTICEAVFKRLAHNRASGINTDVTTAPCPIVALSVKKELESGGLWCEVKINDRKDGWRITTIVPTPEYTREDVTALL